MLFGAGALLAGAGVAAVVALFAFGGGSGGSALAPTQLHPRSAVAAPAPPRDAVVLAQEAGKRAVALSVQPNELTATVLAENGDRESGLKVSFRVGGSTLPARPCGSGCYRATVSARPRRVEVVLPGGSASFRIPASAGPGSRIVARAERVFRRLTSLVYVESLRSGPTGGLVTTWSMTKPDRLSYQIHGGGAAAVVIGDRRWDQTQAGAKWVESPTSVLHVPAPTWGGGVTNARVLGSTMLSGRPVWIVAFATPSVPAWFTAWIEKGSYRTLQLRMTAGAHFMFHRYTEFNAPLKIRPPR